MRRNKPHVALLKVENVEPFGAFGWMKVSIAFVAFQSTKTSIRLSQRPAHSTNFRAARWQSKRHIEAGLGFRSQTKASIGAPTEEEHTINVPVPPRTPVQASRMRSHERTPILLLLLPIPLHARIIVSAIGSSRVRCLYVGHEGDHVSEGRPALGAHLAATASATRSGRGWPSRDRWSPPCCRVGRMINHRPKAERQVRHRYRCRRCWCWRGSCTCSGCRVRPLSVLNERHDGGEASRAGGAHLGSRADSQRRRRRWRWSGGARARGGRK